MRADCWFKAVLCGALAGLLVGFVLTASPQRSLIARVSQRAEDKDSAPARILTVGSRAGLFQQLLKPYLTKLQDEGSLPPADIFKFRSIVASWLREDETSCAEFLNSAGMAVLLKSDSDSLLTSEAVDAHSVLEEAARLPTPELRDRFLRVAIAQLAEKNPVEAFQATHFLPRWLMKAMQKRVAEIWVKKDIRGALQSYFDDETVDRWEVLRYAIHAAAKEDLEQTFGLVSSWPSSSFQWSFTKDSALFDVIAPLDEEMDPKLLWACLQKLPESSIARKNCTKRLELNEAVRGDVALPQVVNRWNAGLVMDVAWRAVYDGKSMAEVIGLLDQVPGINARSEECGRMARVRAVKAPEETVKWATTIAEPPTRAAAFSASFKEWISTAPEKAIAYGLVDRNHDATTRRQLDLQILDWAYSEAPDIDKSLLAKGFQQLSPAQQAQVKEQIISTFDTAAANKVLVLFQ